MNYVFQFIYYVRIGISIYNDDKILWTLDTLYRDNLRSNNVQVQEIINPT